MFENDLLKKLEIHTLPNGSRLFFYYEPNCHFVNFDIVFRAGSIFDPVGKEGLAHFAEHMLTETADMTMMDIIKLFRKKRSKIDLGAIVEMDCDIGFKSRTIRFAPLLKKFLIIALGNNRKYNKRAFNNEREVILREQLEVFPVRKYARLVERSSRFIYEQNPYKHALTPGSVMGTPESVQKITIDDVELFRQTYFNQAQADVVCIGGISKETLDILLETNNVFQSPIKQRITPATRWDIQPGYTDYTFDLKNREVWDGGYNLTLRYGFNSNNIARTNIYLEILDLLLTDYLRVQHPFIYQADIVRTPIPGGTALEFKLKCDPRKITAAERALTRALEQMLYSDDIFHIAKDTLLADLELEESTISNLYETVLEATEPVSITTIEEDWKKYSNVRFTHIQKLHKQITEQSRGTLIRAY